MNRTKSEQSPHLYYRSTINSSFFSQNQDEDNYANLDKILYICFILFFI